MTNLITITTIKNQPIGSTTYKREIGLSTINITVDKDNLFTVGNMQVTGVCPKFTTWTQERTVVERMVKAKNAKPTFLFSNDNMIFELTDKFISRF